MPADKTLSASYRPLILVFTTAYFPLIGGAEVAIREIAKRLPEYDWLLFCARMKRLLPKRETIENVSVFRLGCGLGRLDKILLPFTSFFAAWRLLRSNRVILRAKPEESRSGISAGPFAYAQGDACGVTLWAVMASYGSFGALFVKLLNPRMPFILTLQEGDSEEHVRRRLSLTGPLRWLLFLSVDYMTVISNYLGSLARRLGYRGQIRLVPNGVDLAKFIDENLPLKEKAIKKSLGVPPEAKIAITVSRLVPKNGIEDLLTALPLVTSVNVHLFVIGEGELKERLKALARDLGIAERVHFLGTVPNEEVPSYLGIADVFVRPSLSEGQGISFLEALAMGVPIVATPVGGIPDFLTNAQTGLFVRTADPPSIAAAIERLLGDAQLRRRVIEKGHRLVRERYAWERSVLTMAKIFKNFSAAKNDGAALPPPAAE